ncbi:unnamed protein product, partial [Ectocarpus sp. 13 AM-2016]
LFVVVAIVIVVVVVLGLRKNACLSWSKAAGLPFESRPTAAEYPAFFSGLLLSTMLLSSCQSDEDFTKITCSVFTVMFFTSVIFTIHLTPWYIKYSFLQHRLRAILRTYLTCSMCALPCAYVFITSIDRANRLTNENTSISVRLKTQNASQCH